MDYTFFTYCEGTFVSYLKQVINLYHIAWEDITT